MIPQSTTDASASKAQCKNVLFAIATVLVVLFTFALNLSAVSIGGKAAGLCLKYYDESIQIGGNTSTIYVSIKSLPREVFQTTQGIAANFILTGGASILALIASLFFVVCMNDGKSLAGTIVWVSFLLPAADFLIHGAYVTWKYDTMHALDYTAWDNVDPGFMEVFVAVIRIMYVCIIPGLTGIAVGCYTYCIDRSSSDN